MRPEEVLRHASAWLTRALPKDSEAAEELASQVLDELYERADQGDPAITPAYVRQRAKWRLTDYRRTMGRFVSLDESEAAVAAAVGLDANESEQGEDLAALACVLDEVKRAAPDLGRRVLELRLAGLEPRDIARSLGMDPERIWRALYRMRRHVRRALRHRRRGA